MSSLIESKTCSEIDLPVVFFTTKLAPVDIPDCTSEAVVKPDVTGPIKAIGTIKHPDKVTPRVTITSNLFIIESPFKL